MPIDVSRNYRQGNRPAIITGAAFFISLIITVFVSLSVAGTFVSQSDSADISQEDLTVTRISSVPGYSQAICWAAYTRVAEKNLFGTELIAHKFGVAWCAQDGGIVYQGDITETVYESPNLRSRLPVNSLYQGSYALQPVPESTMLVARTIDNNLAWPNFAVERCVVYSLTADGQAEGTLTCHTS